jgi:hypothetical protein
MWTNTLRNLFTQRCATVGGRRSCQRRRFRQAQEPLEVRTVPTVVAQLEGTVLHLTGDDGSYTIVMTHLPLAGLLVQLDQEQLPYSGPITKVIVRTGNSNDVVGFRCPDDLTHSIVPDLDVTDGNATIMATGGSGVMVVGATGNTTIMAAGDSGVTLLGGNGNDSVPMVGDGRGRSRNTFSTMFNVQVING